LILETYKRVDLRLPTSIY